MCVCVSVYVSICIFMSLHVCLRESLCQCVCLCMSVCICVYMSYFLKFKHFFFNNFRYHGLAGNWFFQMPNKVITKATFADYLYIYILESIFSDFSIDMCRGHLSYFVVTLCHLSMLFLGPASLRQKSGIDFLAHFLFCLN